ncbi:hypothetical protein CW304_26170 [Bacillus sp. UFRGS-B20]|nr:hypothetical protein CW304_26170 [Bacillus sp. UFRGS-B20]
MFNSTFSTLVKNVGDTPLLVRSVYCCFFFFCSAALYLCYSMGVSSYETQHGISSRCSVKIEVLIWVVYSETGLLARCWKLGCEDDGCYVYDPYAHHLQLHCRKFRYVYYMALESFYPVSERG